jgi:hypothetical protein
MFIGLFIVHKPSIKNPVSSQDIYFKFYEELILGDIEKPMLAIMPARI